MFTFERRGPNRGGGLVCMRAAGASLIREKLKTRVIHGDVVGEKHRTATAL